MARHDVHLPTLKTTREVLDLALLALRPFRTSVAISDLGAFRLIALIVLMALLDARTLWTSR
jgi:hypothetical protein